VSASRAERFGDAVETLLSVLIAVAAVANFVLQLVTIMLLAL
jgi:hypothetical protein